MLSYESLQEEKKFTGSVKVEYTKNKELEIAYEAKLLTETIFLSTIIQQDYAFLDNCSIIQFFFL